MYVLSKDAEKKFKQTVIDFCKSEGMPVRKGQEAIDAFLSADREPDYFLLWDALGCDSLSFRCACDELNGLYEYLGEMWSLEMPAATA